MAEREARGAEISRRVAAALVAAEEVENNYRAALGLELNSCVSNQAYLERTLRQVRAQIAVLAKQCAAYGRDYAALEQGVARAGPPAAFLEAVGASLQRTNGHLELIAARLEGGDQ
jgi:hypothetical protein